MARQFDVYHHPQASRRSDFPFVIVLQHNSVPPQSDEVLAAPLAPRDRDGGSRLSPIVEIGGRRHQLFTASIRRVPARQLKSPVASLATNRDRIIAAIDLLFAGS